MCYNFFFIYFSSSLGSQSCQTLNMYCVPRLAYQTTRSDYSPVTCCALIAQQFPCVYLFLSWYQRTKHFLTRSTENAGSNATKPNLNAIVAANSVEYVLVTHKRKANVHPLHHKPKHAKLAPTCPSQRALLI